MTRQELLKKAKKLGLVVKPWFSKQDLETLLEENTVKAETKVETPIPGEVQTKEVEVVKPTSVTFLGSGPLSGEYRFAEIAGSISASSLEEAIQKAEEIVEKFPNLLK